MEKPPYQDFSHNKEETRKEEMNMEIREAGVSETARLAALDASVFQSEEPFTKEQWKQFHSFWIYQNGIVVGSFSLCPNKGVWDPPDADAPPDQQGSLYIVSTGILPEFQGQGLGTKVKEYQVAYAREHGFTSVVTNCRKGNAPIIHLNKKFGFIETREIPHYYHNPDESAIVLELPLK